MKKKLLSLITSVVIISSLITSSIYKIGDENISNSNFSESTLFEENQIEKYATIEGNESIVSGAGNKNVNKTMMQYFEWDLSSDGTLWNKVTSQSDDLANVGFTALWLPPAYKGGSVYDVGYGAYDLYDLGEFNQKGTVRTKYGTKDQYLAAIKAAHSNGIEIYADIVLNHKGNADGTEEVMATRKDWGNRNNSVGTEKTIRAWTVFNFPGRGNTYSSFKWDASCFDAVDYDDSSKTNAIYLFKDKNWDWKVDNENANYDYLMFSDVDFDSEKVVNELKSWGKWYVDIANLDGFRLDAVKHIKYSFYYDWLTYLRNSTGKALFTVGEFWSGDINKLKEYISETKGSLSLFDVPLHNHMREASVGNGYYDMRYILNGTLVKEKSNLAVTFVDNHDTQPGQSLESYVLDWFKPLAYTLILTRDQGYPCVFYGDYYGTAKGGKSFKYDLDKLMKARTECAYGTQHDYFDDANIVGWTREGDSAHTNSGLASIITDGAGGSKKMYVGSQHAGEVWHDITGHISEKVTIDSQGYGVFKVSGGSNSVYVSSKIEGYTQNTNGNNSLTVYYKTSWSNPYAHYCVGGGVWTEAPGVKMTKLTGGYYKITIPMGGEENVTICFNDGNGTWDNNNSRDYNFSPGEYTLDNGKITKGAPSGVTEPSSKEETSTKNNSTTGNEQKTESDNNGQNTTETTSSTTKETDKTTEKITLENTAQENTSKTAGDNETTGDTTEENTENVTDNEESTTAVEEITSVEITISGNGGNEKETIIEESTTNNNPTESGIITIGPLENNDNDNKGEDGGSTILFVVVGVVGAAIAASVLLLRKNKKQG